MKRNVVLSLKGTQIYMDQEPDVIELVTDGILETIPTGWKLSYEESALTGLEGVTTMFVLEEDCVTLTRTGSLNSQMVFRKDVPHESLYEMEFGALMISVCASSISWNLSEDGGCVDLKYQIEIEHSSAGVVEYHLDVQKK